MVSFLEVVQQVAVQAVFREVGHLGMGLGVPGVQTAEGPWVSSLDVHKMVVYSLVAHEGVHMVLALGVHPCGALGVFAMEVHPFGAQEVPA